MVLFTLACGVSPVLAVAAEQAGVKVTAIEIRGNKRIELPAIATPLRMSVDKSKFSTNLGSLKKCRWKRNRERAGWPWLF